MPICRARRLSGDWVFGYHVRLGRFDFIIPKEAEERENATALKIIVRENVLLPAFTEQFV